MNTPIKSITWSECLKRALQSIDENIVLYMQEDYFIKNFVKIHEINNLLELMIMNKEIDCVHLTDKGGHLGLPSSYHNNLSILASPQRYFTNCQAALWKKSTFLSLLRPYENAWQFEEFGSKRAEKLNPLFLGVSREWVAYGQFEIIPYIWTGIIKDRWFEPVIELFDKHEIVVDFSKRGFYKDPPKRRSLQTKIKYRLNRFKVLFYNWLNFA